jgi:glycosyltransferase involved in cell wall biosynthesis
MNILFIGSSADWHVDLWVQYFAERHSVFLFSDDEEYLKDQPFKNVAVVKSGGYLGGVLNRIGSSSHFLFQINKVISVRRFAKHVDRVIKENNIEIIHSHSLYYGYLSSFVKTQIPRVFTPMGSDVIIHSQENRIYRHMAKSAFSKVQMITGDSLLLQSKGYLVGASKKKNYIVQNGVDSSIFFPKSNQLKKKYAVPDDGVLIFSPRAITPIYNIDIIIDSIAELKNAGYEVKCMFSFAFGDEYSQRLLAQSKKLGLENNIIWLGSLTYKEMAEYYNGADLVVSVPSSDSSPKSVYEAMFCGKPVIVSDLEWTNELVNECDCLLKVPVRDSKQLANSVITVIEKGEVRKNLAKNALQHSSKYFDYEKNMKLMEKLMLMEIELK